MENETREEKRARVLESLAEAKRELERLEALVQDPEVDFERISLVMGITEPLDAEYGTWGSSLIGLAGDLSLNMQNLAHALEGNIEEMLAREREADEEVDEVEPLDHRQKAQELGLVVIEGGLNGKPTIH